ncbi:hypothetical protein PanWU01x14_348650 [Parasponia andersonii]|uniref:Uncharacterized protein n=1 Tax=Parasponia andersonii TaxID=3476 RepID=A0A2P5ABP0_PARAD|nr:hypothetical protein PanWU01x14_348650 [Parasponia andersonii]
MTKYLAKVEELLLTLIWYNITKVPRIDNAENNSPTTLIFRLVDGILEKVQIETLSKRSI